MAKLGTRRQRRYEILRAAAMRPFEARAFSRVSFKRTPYIEQIMKDRWAMFMKAKAEGLTQRQWIARVNDLYARNRWYKRNKAGRLVADPWRLFRKYEDEFKAKQPQYESPWVRKQKDWRNFLANIERYMKQRRGLQPG